MIRLMSMQHAQMKVLERKILLSGMIDSNPLSPSPWELAKISKIEGGFARTDSSITTSNDQFGSPLSTPMYVCMYVCI
jgi:hypothetical protein